MDERASVEPPDEPEYIEGYVNPTQTSDGHNNDFLKVRDLLQYPDTNSSDDEDADVRRWEPFEEEKKAEDERLEEVARRKEVRDRRTPEEVEQDI